MKKLIPILIALALLLSACEQPAADENGDASPSQPQESSGILPGPVDTAPAGTSSPNDAADPAGTSSPNDTVPAQNDGDMFTDRDGRTGYDVGSSVRIKLNGDSSV